MKRNLNNYRIRKVTIGNSQPYYYPQKRNWFGLWFDMFEVNARNYDKFTSYRNASDAVHSKLLPIEVSIDYLPVVEPN